MSSFFGAGEWRAFMLDGAVSQSKAKRNPPRRVTSEAEKFLEKEILKRNSRNEPLGISRQRNSRVARKKLTKCQVFLGQANREHLCSMEPFRNLKAKRNPPRRAIDEATETFLRFQKRSSKLVSRQEFQEGSIMLSIGRSC